MRHLLTATALGLALAAPATAQDGVRVPNAPIADLGGFPAVLSGLAHEMAAAAEHLRADGQRRRATEAMDRALHLAEFGAHAAEAGPETATTFRSALEAVREGRHALQMGRPEDAADRLDQSAQALQKDHADEAAATPALAEPAEMLVGLKVLNQRGQHLGELIGFEDGERGSVAIVAHGGFLWWGRERERLPVEALLGSESFVVLPSPVAPSDFGDLQLIRIE